MTWDGFIEPEIDPDTQWFWDGVEQHQLLVRRCNTCGRCTLPPTPGCPHCGSEDWSALAAAGTGKLYSWVVCHRAMDPVFLNDVPYTIVAVELDEGARIYGRLHGDVALSDGMPMRVVFVEAGPDRRPFYAFEPA